MRNLMAGALFALSLSSTAYAAIQEEAVTYKDGDTVMKGVIVHDDAKKGKRPGIVVVHEWWGITAHTREEARKFAAQGYTAFVADMYGEAKTADNPTDASGLMKGLMGNPAGMQSRFNAAQAQLAKHATVDAKKIGASGYCMGGAVVLNMARAGADDPFVKPESIEAFKKEMDAAKVNYKFINYPGAVHAFTNPEATAKGKQFKLPLAYNAEADKQAKAEAAKFFQAAFK